MTAPPETERQDGWMESGRGSEQHFQPVWKHERGRKEGREGKKEKKKGKRLWETRRWALAWSREVGAPVRKT